ncbi:MAG: type I restriction enzyme HsdR N-terminal domain-containing protein [Methanothrix sp.]
MVSDTYAKADEIQIKGSQIFSPVRQKWLLLTPEELVRQEYLKILIQEYDYHHNQIAEEMDVTGRGSAQARADFVIWRTSRDRLDQKPPLIFYEYPAACCAGAPPFH